MNFPGFLPRVCRHLVQILVDAQHLCFALLSVLINCAIILKCEIWSMYNLSSSHFVLFMNMALKRCKWCVLQQPLCSSTENKDTLLLISGYTVAFLPDSRQQFLLFLLDLQGKMRQLVHTVRGHGGECCNQSQKPAHQISSCAASSSLLVIGLWVRNYCRSYKLHPNLRFSKLQFIWVYF